MFSSLGISHIHHYAPLHYLPFLARSMSLKSKPALTNDGFATTHFRSTSSRTDITRGFGNYAFLTLEKEPKIVKAKLAKGFPHIEFLIPISEFNNIDFDLCRYNVAKSRRTLSSPTGGFKESNTNGRYYGNKQLPIARTPLDKENLLSMHYPAGNMIEVLVEDKFDLPSDTIVTCFHKDDLGLAKTVLSTISVPWKLEQRPPPGNYPRSSQYVQNVDLFIRQALRDPDWKGNGLEFDRV